MSFAALPRIRPVSDVVPGDKTGIAINLIPIYGIVMPIIIRKGELQVTAALANPRLDHGPNGAEFAVEITRMGTASAYGDLLVFPRGGNDPVFVARGIGVYPEIGARHAAFAISPEQEAALKGPVRVEFREAVESGGALIAAVDAALG